MLLEQLGTPDRLVMEFSRSIGRCAERAMKIAMKIARFLMCPGSWKVEV